MLAVEILVGDLEKKRKWVLTAAKAKCEEKLPEISYLDSRACTKSNHGETKGFNLRKFCSENVI
jgi:hypothetical protein